ncbi:CPBP family intramembrane metalloprotease [Polynucleobacter paludilacus]|uniref:CPBP family intramembrane glutamic endopeptidase n=1 Tax=Polynucleobacter paludilacus TaxID=1855895 RepID=UPI001BFD5FE2|nr:CPBP family intramembrane glutamic endopeptidase [Polynucleobacter paludilacus]QWD86987.1 CPBP family intramembrane metalloprotease [Polynucleobacter paludilacus]
MTFWLWCELALFSLVSPFSLMLLHSAIWFIPLLWAAGLLCFWYLHHQNISLKILWGWHAVNKSSLLKILYRFVPLAIMITAVMVSFMPESLFSLYRRDAGLWLLVMILYPVLSVVPQEIMYRAFMYERYRLLFSNGQNWVIASAVAFGMAHLFLHNLLAPAMSLIGGLLFANTYSRSRSLALVCIEHALYGNFIFTLGLGQYFYHGTVMHS